MKQIKMVDGTYGYRPRGSMYPRPKSASDPPFEVEDAEAERLVAMKAAIYADPVVVKDTARDENAYEKMEGSLISFIDGADDAQEAVATAFVLLAQVAANACVELPVFGVATTEDDENGGGAGDDASDDERPVYSAEMTIAELKELFNECKLKYKVGMRKDEMVARLDEHFAGDGGNDDDDPPQLGAAGPVV